MATAGSLLAQLKPFTLASRSLFVKCVPAPSNFYERRAVLAVLQRSSEQSIETFKKLQDNSSFIAVTTKPDAATTLLNASPLERTVAYQDSTSGVASTPSTWSSNYDDVSGPIAAPVNLLPVEAANPTPASVDMGLSYKTFALHIFPANADYDHREEIRKSPLHGPWPGDGKTQTFISAALQRVVPAGAMAPALRDWETGNQLAYDSDSFADNGPQGAAATLLGKQRYSAREAFLMERIRRRGAEEATPKIMSGIFKFAEECRTKAAETQPEVSQNTTSESSQAQTNDA